MLRIIDVRNKSENTLKDLEKEVSNLLKLNKKNNSQDLEIVSSLSKIHFKLNEYEYLHNLKNQVKQNLELNNIKTNENLKIEIPRKITINNNLNQNNSKSFVTWLFNNKEL